MYKKISSDGDLSQYLETFFNNMPQGFSVFDVIYVNELPVNYEFVMANETFLNLLGLPKEEVIGNTILEIFDTVEFFWIDAFNKVATNFEPYHFEDYLSGYDKHFKVTIFSPSEGQIACMFSDITEEKKIIETLQLHKLLFEGANDAILYIKSDGTIINANASASKMYGYPSDELIRKKLQDLRHPSSAKYYNEQMTKADTQGITYEILHVKKSGESFPAEVSTKSVFVENEKIKMHIVRNIQERKKTEATVMYLANYDSLTDVANRTCFFKRFANIIDRATKGIDTFALLLFDIDKFKIINDTHGHIVGDAVLKTIVERIKANLRKTDLFGRLGGDEFVILQSFVRDAEDVENFIQRIYSSIAPEFEVEGLTLKIGISMGVCIFDQNSANNEKDIIAFADEAMYEAKQKGGNSYVIHK